MSKGHGLNTKEEDESIQTHPLLYGIQDYLTVPICFL